MRYIASAPGTQKHDHFDSSIESANEKRKADQQKYAYKPVKYIDTY